MAKYRFRLLHGTHKGEPKFEMQQNGEMRKVAEGPTYIAKNPAIPFTQEPGYRGDIIETDLNLSAMFDQKGAIAKFQDITRGDTGGAVTKESLLQEIEDRKKMLEELDKGKPAFGDATLDDMPLEALKKMAVEEAIDVGKAKTKEEYLKVIKAAMHGLVAAQ